MQLPVCVHFRIVYRRISYRHCEKYLNGRSIALTHPSWVAQTASKSHVGKRRRRGQIVLYFWFTSDGSVPLPSKQARTGIKTEPTLPALPLCRTHLESLLFSQSSVCAPAMCTSDVHLFPHQQLCYGCSHWTWASHLLSQSPNNMLKDQDTNKGLLYTSVTWKKVLTWDQDQKCDQRIGIPRG